VRKVMDQVRLKVKWEAVVAGSLVLSYWPRTSTTGEATLTEFGTSTAQYFTALAIFPKSRGCSSESNERWMKSQGNGKKCRVRM